MEMHKQEGLLTDAEMESMTSVQASEVDNWANFKDNDIMQQQSAILAEDVIMRKFQEPLSSLAAEYQSRRRRILLEKIEVLREQYASIRRTRGDENCLGISAMFTYLEFLLKSDRGDDGCITVHVEECRKALQRLESVEEGQKKDLEDDAWLNATFHVRENKRYTGW